jgi:phosphatidylglycerophosphate synthase
MPDQIRTALIARSRPWGEVRRALSAAQKSNRNAPAYSRWVNRPLGRVFAASAYKLGLSPNAISLISASFTFSGIALIATATPSLWLGVTIAALLVVGYALDSADGQVARLQGGGSLAGEWLDHVLDSFKTTSFHLAVVVMWVRNLEGWDLWTTVVPFVFTLQASVWFFTIILTDLLMRAAGRKQQTLAIDEGRQPIWTSLLGIPADYGFLCLVMALLGWYPGWRWIYLLLAAANVVLLGLQLARWYRRVAAEK